MSWWDNIVKNLRSSFGGPSYAWDDSTNVQEHVDAGFMPSDSTAVQQPGGQPNPTNISPAMTGVEPESDYDRMMGDFTKHWGQSKEGLENIMNQVSHHESKGENVYQTGGGPGAGLFQYETGAGQGGMTARNRLANWYGGQGMEVPQWLNQEGMDTQGFDAAQLSPEQQKMLFMADKRYHPTASLSPEATSDIADWWGKNHWAGAEVGSQEYTDKIGGFRHAPSQADSAVNNVMQNYHSYDLDSLQKNMNK